MTDPLEFTDHRAAPTAWARSLGISSEAVQLYLASEVIDLHVDSFIWTRLFGYDLHRRHQRGALGRHVYGQVDLPRVREAQLSGATWVITTNPARSAQARAKATVRNIAKLRSILEGAGAQVAVVRNAAEYRAARAAGKHGAFIGLQGGNALDESLDSLDRIDDTVLRITLVHLSSSRLGVTSSPLRLGGHDGLTDFGRAYVRRLNEKKIFVDLAHIGRQGFFDAVAVHDPSQPLLVTHTGVAGVHPHWRNLDDEQLRTVAGTGGTVGVMFQSSFLGDSMWHGKASSVVDHLEHIIETVGEDHASIGSDFDGAITPPRDLPSCLELPRLVQQMLDRGWSDTRIRKILGDNFLRVVATLRG